MKNASTYSLSNRFIRHIIEKKVCIRLFFSMTLRLETIVFSQHNLYNDSFFLVKTGILERILNIYR